jgi:hypothetical protein
MTNKPSQADKTFCIVRSFSGEFIMKTANEAERLAALYEEEFELHAWRDRRRLEVQAKPPGGHPRKQHPDKRAGQR